MVEIVGAVSVINGAYPVLFLDNLYFIFVFREEVKNNLVAHKASKNIIRKKT